MHGYAHNRPCQLQHHPKYVDGTGIEDFETCERFFSISNNCAGITRYSTPFHRLQVLDLHFSDSDEQHRLALGKFIYSNYRETLTRIREISKLFFKLKLDALVRDGTYKEYLKEEAEHFANLRYEPLQEQSRFKYVHALQQLWRAEGKLDAATKKYRIQPSLVIPLQAKLPTAYSQALNEFNLAQAIVGNLEVSLGISLRWQPSSQEYQDALEWAGERTYRLALDKLERLLVQRLFELQKANLISTGTFSPFSP